MNKIDEIIDYEDVLHTLNVKIKNTDSGEHFITYKYARLFIKQQQEKIENLKKEMKLIKTSCINSIITYS